MFYFHHPLPRSIFIQQSTSSSHRAAKGRTSLEEKGKTDDKVQNSKVGETPLVEDIQDSSLDNLKKAKLADLIAEEEVRPNIEGVLTINLKSATLLVLNEDSAENVVRCYHGVFTFALSKKKFHYLLCLTSCIQLKSNVYAKVSIRNIVKRTRVSKLDSKEVYNWGQIKHFPVSGTNSTLDYLRISTSS